MCISQQLPVPAHSPRRTQISYLLRLRAPRARSEDHKTKSAAGVALVTTHRVLWTSGGAASAVRLEHVVRTEQDVRTSNPRSAPLAPSPHRQLCRRALVDEVLLRTQGGSFFGLASSAKIILGFTVSGTERRLKLAFHDGGRDDFLAAIQGALEAKSWVVRRPQPSPLSRIIPSDARLCVCAATEQKYVAEPAKRAAAGGMGALERCRSRAQSGHCTWVRTTMSIVR